MPAFFPGFTSARITVARPKSKHAGERWCLVSRLARLAIVALALWCCAIAPAAARGNLGNEVLYFITVDRFYDGEPGNNRPIYAFSNASQNPAYRQANQLLVEHAYDPAHRYINLFWGGDLEGIIQKLDYLQDLGVTQLVLSPIQDSANGLIYDPEAVGFVHDRPDPATETFDPLRARLATAFQGDWPRDWFEIDEHFRNPNDENSDRFRVLRRLLDAAGDRGIGVILSLHCNHTSPVRYSSEYADFTGDRYETWLTDNGAVYRHGRKVATYFNFNTGERNPDGWFHAPVALDYARPTANALEKTQVGGLPDLAQENPVVRDYLLDAVCFWLHFNAGGRRIAGLYFDSTDNINLSFWQAVELAARQIAPEAILIGQYPSGGYKNRGALDWYTGTESFTWLNYDLSDATRRYFARDRAWDGRSVLLRELTLGKDGEYYNYNHWQRLWHKLLNPSESLQVPREALDRVPDDDVRGWVTFLENRDRPRLYSGYPNLSARAYASALAFNTVAPGVPMLTYGAETGLAIPYHIDNRGMGGIGSDPYNQPMAIWPGDRGWNETTYRLTRELIHLRHQYSVLRRGNTRYIFPRRSHRANDIFLVREEATGPKVLLAYSTRGGRFTVPVAEDRSNCTYAELGDLDTQVAAESCEITLALAPEETRVFVVR